MVSSLRKKATDRTSGFPTERPHEQAGKGTKPQGPTNAPLSKRANPFYRKALLYHRSGRVSDAIVLYEKVLQFDVGHEGATLNLAAAHIEKEHFHAAQRILKQMEFSPTRPRGVLLNLAITAIGTGDANQALAYLKIAQETSDASMYEIDFHRAVAYSRLERLPEALALYQKILKERPDDASVRFNLAVTCDALGLYPKALEHYKVSLQSSSDADETSIHRRIQALERYLTTNQHPIIRQ